MKLVGEDLQKTNIDNGSFPYLGDKQIADSFIKQKALPQNNNSYKLQVSSTHLSVIDYL
jgi:hypothetical protein